MPDAIGKPMNPTNNPTNNLAENLTERGSAATPTPRKRRWWMAAVIVIALAVGAFAAYRYLHLCGNCGPIICDNPCSLPTFSQAPERSGTDA
jgi:hypothetical protein